MYILDAKLFCEKQFVMTYKYNSAHLIIASIKLACPFVLPEPTTS